MRALRDSLGSLVRFLHCDIVAVWSWVDFTCSGIFFGSYAWRVAMSFFGYLLHSGAALLRGSLPVRYCSQRLGARTPSWKLPAVGEVAGLITSGGEVVGLDRASAVVNLPALCMLRLEELEAVGWKELEVPGRECDLPEKLHVPSFTPG